MSALLAEVEHTTKTRKDIITFIYQQWGAGETTEYFIDYVEDMWETVDMLFALYGQDARSLILYGAKENACIEDFPFLVAMLERWQV